MMRDWEAHTDLRSGLAKIVFNTGETITIRNDGSEGLDFAREYINEIRRYYPSHLEAADLKLRQRLGRAYKTIRDIPHRYIPELALVSLNCCFGKEDEIPDRERSGDFNPEYVLCPERYHCPFNGFNPDFRHKRCVCCNPVYECGLTATQTRVADLLVNTSLSHEDIAVELGCSYSNVDNIRKRIFASLGVATRPELIILLRGKRLL